MSGLCALLVVLVSTSALYFVGGQTDGFNISTPKGYTVLATHANSTLYQIEDDSYSPKAYLVSLYGSHYEVRALLQPLLL